MASLEARPTIDALFAAACQAHSAGRMKEAESIYRQILASDPRHADALYRLGVLAFDVGKLDAALQLIDQAAAINPGSAEYLATLGDVLSRLGRCEPAIAAYRRSAAINPGLARVQCNLGNLLCEIGQFEQSVAASRRAIALMPALAQAHNNLGKALVSQGHLAGAADAYRRAIEINPSYAVAIYNLGNVLLEQEKFDGAIAAYEQAISLEPRFFQAQGNLGSAWEKKGNIEGAIAAYRRAVAIEAAYADGWSNLGHAVAQLGEVDEAIDHLRRAVQLQPEFAAAHFNLALTLLLQGKFAEGWREYEWRWRTKKFPSPVRNFSQPLWDGSALAGRRILLHTEQGFGDAIQFCRYVPMVAARGGHVILECPPELHRLLQTLPGVDELIVKGTALPRFEVHAPLLTLPLAFGTRVESIPQPGPYLRCDPTLASAALEAPGRKIGLVWAGSTTHRHDRNRSIPLPLLEPLTQLPGTRFFSLQKQRTAADAAILDRLSIVDLSGGLTDFADTAAVVAKLDLVLTVDTAVAHLAGAMGKKVWVMLPFAPDWRWLRERRDSPWYPTMRLFRQPRPGDWESVVQQVVMELADE